MSGPGRKKMEYTDMEKRVFLVVLDSFGIGAEPDAAAFGDEGTNTLGAIARHPNFDCPNLQRLGLFNIDGVTAGVKTAAPTAAFARLQEQSMGKDTTIGHWEIAGVVSPRPLPTFPEGFPEELIREYEAKTGHKVLCNKPYSGTQVLKDYGEQAMREDALIVYTSADSVFQVAANEEQVPVQQLYRYCEMAREMLKGEYGVGRVIARPYLGNTAETFYRTTNRHDLSLKPPRATMLDLLKEAGKDVIAVGKIFDIFDGEGAVSSTTQTPEKTEVFTPTTDPNAGSVPEETPDSTAEEPADSVPEDQTPAEEPNEPSTEDPAATQPQEPEAPAESGTDTAGDAPAFSAPTREQVEQAASSIYNAASTILDAIYGTSQNDAD